MKATSPCRSSAACIRGDFNRKSVLSEFGFRLPSCVDNRPLKFEEWETLPAADDVRLRHARPVGDGAHRRRVRRTGDPPDRADRSGDRGAPGGAPGGRSAGRMPRRRGAGRARAGHHADQAHGGGPDGLPDRARREGALSALRHRHAGADRDHPRPALGRVRRAGGHQPAARGARYSGMRAGGDPGCRQGGFPALADLADPDHRPRGAQHRRPGDPVCRHDDQQSCAARSRKPSGGATSSGRGTRRTASRRCRSSGRSARCWRACSSRTTSPWRRSRMPAWPSSSART